MKTGEINWYPGHMKKTRELIAAHLKLTDIVLEVIDARIPVSSRNPVLDSLIEKKTRLILFNKADLADPAQTKAWTDSFAEKNILAFSLDSLHGSGIGALLKQLDGMATVLTGRAGSSGARVKTVKLMIVGVPNVGKSSLINRLTGRKGAKTGDRPGVTRGKQWLAMPNGMLLLDTPGILWPKFEDPGIGRNLAFCGSVKDEILDRETLAFHLIDFLAREYPQLLQERYALEEPAEDALTNMDAIAIRRGFLLSGGRIDYERTARTVLDEFRSGKIGRITLEKVNR